MAHSERPRRILLVEDEALIALDLEATLTDAGHAVEIAFSVDQALRAARPDFDLAILDGFLRRRPSIPVACRLDAMGVPLVFLSSLLRPADIRDRFPDAALLHKPAPPAVLLRTVAAQLRRAEAVDRAAA